MAAAHEAGLKVRGAVSCTLGCPYQGDVSPDEVERVVDQLKGSWPILGPDRTVVDVFDPAGTFLGRVTPPGRIVPSPAPAIRGNRLVGLVRDEDDVETVWVMRIEKPGR